MELYRASQVESPNIKQTAHYHFLETTSREDLHHHKVALLSSILARHQKGI